MGVMEKLVEICFHEFCMVAGDSPCGCDGCPYGKYGSENNECFEAYKKQKFEELEKAGVTVQEDCRACAEATQNCIVKLQEQIAELRLMQEWISVKDRLPEEEGLYLVAVVNDHERRYSKTAWYHGHGNWFLHQKVTHWQYLPQPPKGE